MLGQHFSKQDTSTQCLTNGEPPSMTLARHWSTLGRCVVFAGLFITLQCLRIILILPNQRRHYDCDLARFQVRFVFHRPPH